MLKSVGYAGHIKRGDMSSGGSRAGGSSICQKFFFKVVAETTT